MRSDKHLQLSQEEITIIDAPEPAEVLIPLEKSGSNNNRIRLKVGDHLDTGNEILPGLFSPVSGTIKNIEPLIVRNGEVSSLRVELDEKEEQDSEIKAEPDFRIKKPVEIVKILNRANLGFNKSLEPMDTVVISVIEQDPLSLVQQQIWRENKFLTLEGLRLIKHLSSARKIIFAIPQNLSESAAEIPPDAAEVFLVKPYYPMGLPEVLIAEISRTIDVGKCGFMNAEKMIAAVVALKEGKTLCP